MKLNIVIFSLLLGSAPLSHASSKHDDHGHAPSAQATPEKSVSDHGSHTNDSIEANGGHGHEEDSVSTITEEMAQRNGITVAEAAPGTIERHLRVYGRLDLPPDQRVDVRARFTGLVKSVAVSVGQTVSKGDVLATVESNDSLKDYAVRAPIAGVVQARQSSVGEITGSTPLFTLVNTQRLWATMQVFSGQRFEVKPGLPVHVVHNGHRHESTIESLAPADNGEPYVLARTTLENPSGDMAPGDLVTGEIDAEIISVALVVANEALQTHDGKTVVFVREGNRYHAQPVKVGRTDGRYTEILSGLKPGDHYVIENSYLIKADIEKSGAAHEH